ncbi:hypothetical protein PHMEG_00022331, partial [Phytophthora megakarya]
MDMGSPNSKDGGDRKTARLSTDGLDSARSQKVLSFDESGERARIDLIEDHYADDKEKKSEQQPEEGTRVQTQVFRSDQEDGSVETKTVRTTRTTTRSSSGDFVTTIEVQTTTETETKDGVKNTTVETETSTETVADQVSTFTQDDGNADDVQTQVFRSVEEDGSVVTKTVQTTRRTVVTNGVAMTTVEVQTTTETEATDGSKTTNVSMETRTEVEQSTSGYVAEEEVTSNSGDELASSFSFGKKREYHKQWHPQFMSYLDGQDKRVETLSTSDLLECARMFCRENFAEFHPELFNGESIEKSKACWEVVTQLAIHYPLVAVQSLALDFGEKNLLIMDEVAQGFDSENHLRKEVVLSMVGHSKTEACPVFDDLLVLNNGEVVYHGAGEDIVKYVNDLDYQSGPGQRVAKYLLSMVDEGVDRYRITVPTYSKSDGSGNPFIKPFAVLMKFADDGAIIAGENTESLSAFHRSATNYFTNNTSSISENSTPIKLPVPNSTTSTEENGAAPGESVKTEVFQSEEADGSIVTKTVRTTTRTETSPAGELVTTIEVETTTETETKGGAKSTTVE